MSRKHGAARLDGSLGFGDSRSESNSPVGRLSKGISKTSGSIPSTTFLRRQGGSPRPSCLNPKQKSPLSSDTPYPWLTL